MLGSQRLKAMWNKFQALPCYFGGKRKLVKDIFNHAKKDKGVFVDAFLGGGSVSLYAKAKGYKVIANDIALRSYITGKVFIENSRIKLNDEDLARLFIKTKHDGFIKKNYCPKVFVSKTADFLDNAFAVVRGIENETKRNLLTLTLIKFILSTRQFGKFTHTKDTLDLEKNDYEWPLRSKSHAPKNLRMIQHPLLTLKEIKKTINKGIFDNNQENEIHKEDVFNFLKHVKGDVIYFDPPYPESSAYEDEYYILDCILAGEKIKKEKSVFSKADGKIFIEKMLECSKHIPQWIISLGQTKADMGIKPEELMTIVQKHRKAELQMLDHKWSVANAGGRPQGDNIEYLVVTL